MTYIDASDSKGDIQEYIRKTWPRDNNISAAPKFQNAINFILKRMSEKRKEQLAISRRRAESIINGEASAKYRSWENAAIQELLKEADHEETAFRERFFELQATLASQQEKLARQAEAIASLQEKIEGRQVGRQI